MKPLIEPSIPARRRDAFTLLELLVVVAVIGILAAVLVPALRGVLQRSHESQAANHLRQLGLANAQFTADHDGALPIRLGSWPTLLNEYLDDPRVFAEPNSKTNYLTLGLAPIASGQNHTSYILNSFDDLGLPQVRLVNIEHPTDTILMAAQWFRFDSFVMNIRRRDDIRSVPYRQYRNGAYYLYVDGSVRYVAASDYRPAMWMADKGYQLP